jgi:hypothetical protein
MDNRLEKESLDWHCAGMWVGEQQRHTWLGSKEVRVLLDELVEILRKNLRNTTEISADRQTTYHL